MSTTQKEQNYKVHNRVFSCAQLLFINRDLAITTGMFFNVPVFARREQR